MNKLSKIALYVIVAGAFIASTAEADYWISSTGKTHNSSCRYYQKGKGRLSKTPSTVNCKVCKGANGGVSAEGVKAAREYIEKERREREGQQTR